eukprot:4484530-Prymnesium_polylepis.2
METLCEITTCASESDRLHGSTNLYSRTAVCPVAVPLVKSRTSPAFPWQHRVQQLQLLLARLDDGTLGGEPGHILQRQPTNSYTPQRLDRGAARAQHALYLVVLPLAQREAHAPRERDAVAHVDALEHLQRRWRAFVAVGQPQPAACKLICRGGPQPARELAVCTWRDPERGLVYLLTAVPRAHQQRLQPAIGAHEEQPGRVRVEPPEAAQARVAEACPSRDVEHRKPLIDARVESHALTLLRLVHEEQPMRKRQPSARAEQWRAAELHVCRFAEHNLPVR